MIVRLGALGFALILGLAGAVWAEDVGQSAEPSAEQDAQEGETVEDILQSPAEDTLNAPAEDVLDLDSSEPAETAVPVEQKSITGRVDSIDSESGQLTITSEQGEQVILEYNPAQFGHQAIEPGTEVTALYEERGDQKTATSLSFGEPQQPEGLGEEEPQGEMPQGEMPQGEQGTF